MRTVKVTINGERPQHTASIERIKALNGQKVVKGKYGTAYQVNEEVNFIVFQLRTLQGNSYDRNAWLADPKDPQFSVRIEW